MILPRLALGTVQPHASATLMARALMAGFQQRHIRVQSFCSQAVLQPDYGAQAITGRQQRHLDTWLMSPEMCTAVFCHNMREADVAVVEGRYQSACSGPAGEFACLDTLCQWLDLPQLVVLNVEEQSACEFRMPEMPIDGILLDGVRNEADYTYWATNFECLWRAPVLGGLGRLHRWRQRVSQLKPRQALTVGEVKDLGREFLRWSRLDDILAIAGRAWPRHVSCWQFPGQSRSPTLRIAWAWDDAFHCYYPDTLDALAALGAELLNFSPLHDEQLPPHTDIVYLGCGCVEQFAEALYGNHCLRCNLREFARRGGRMYAECSALAYLCQHVEIAGRQYPMAGILPATAVRCQDAPPVRPVRLQLSTDTWLGRAGEEIRGYLNPVWKINFSGPITDLSQSPELRGNLFQWRNVIGSRVHLNFGLQPMVLRHLMEPVTSLT